MNTHARGFTLVELLVALFVMAILAAMAWQGVDGITRTKQVGQERMEQTLRLDTVLMQWEQDLAALHDMGSEELTIKFDGASIRVARRNQDGVSVVVWAAREGKLQRWIGPPVTRLSAFQEQWMRTFQFLGNEPGQIRMLTGVASMQVYCYRRNSWSNCQSTADTVPQGKAGGPPPPPDALAKMRPDGVRLVLTLSGAGAQGTLTRDVMLPPQPLGQPGS